MKSLFALVNLLRQYRLLDSGQLEELKNLQQHDFDLRALAKELVRRGWLTVYQVNEVSRGRTDRLLLGSYVLLEKLGEGGMGAVFKARNWKLGQTVALKLIRKERLTNPNAIKRFHREIRAAAQLSHPNIVRAHDADEANGTHFFVMEFVEGIDLAKLTKQKGPLPIADACDYIRQAAMGLQHAFERGLVHRDIKPANLLLATPQGALAGRTSDSGKLVVGGKDKGPTSGTGLATAGVVKILDMGLARIDHEDGDGSTLTQEGVVMGTPDYIAPEQARASHTVDTRADLYSLGCTLYFLLTGSVPFPGGTMTEKLIKHQLEDAVPVELKRTDVPAGVGQIIRKLMAKRAQDRFQTPVELALALDALTRPGAAPQSSPKLAPSTTAAPAPASGVKMTPPPAAAIKPVAPASTGDVFSELQSTATQMLTPEIVKPHKAKAEDLSLPLKIGVASLCAFLAIFLIVVSVRLFRASEPHKPDDYFATNKHTEKKKTPPPAKTLTDLEKKRLADEEAEQNRQAAEKAALQQRLAKEKKLHKQRVAVANDALPALEDKVKAGKLTFAAFAQEVQAFKAKHGGTSAAVKAAEMLMRLPSPLDQLDSRKLPEDAREFWQRTGNTPPEELVGVLGQQRGRHWHGYSHARFAPNGKWLATASHNQIIFWDPRTLCPLTSFQGTGSVHAFALSPDGTRLVFANGSGPVSHWSLAGDNCQEKDALTGHPNNPYSFVFSPDSKTVAYHSGDQIWLWDVAEPKPRVRYVIKELPTNPPTILFSPDGKRLAFWFGDGIIQVWDVNQGDPKPWRLIVRDKENFWSVAWSPDSQRLATACASGRGSLWDLRDQEPKEKVIMGTGATRMAISPNGKNLAIGLSSGERVQLWDISATEPTLRHRRLGHAEFVDGITFSPDGTKLFSSGQDGKVRAWDVATLQELHSLDGALAAVSPDGKTLLFTQGCALGLLDLAAGKEVHPLRGPTNGITALAWSPDAQYLLTSSADMKVCLWHVSDKTELLSAPVGKRSAGPSPIAFSPDGKNLAYATVDHLIIWDTDKKTARHQLPGGSVILGLDFSPNGQTLASAVGSSGSELWNVATGAKQLHVASPSTSVVAFSPSGDWFATGEQDSCIHFFEPGKGEKIDLVGPFPAVPRWLAFSPGGETLASVSGPLNLMDSLTKKDRLSLPAGPFAFSPDGKTLALAKGHVIGLHNLPSGKSRQEIGMPGPVNCLAFAPDGRHLAVANTNGTVFILRPGDKPPAVLTAALAPKRQQEEAKQLGVEAALTNSVGMKLTLIPSGRFLMGAPETEVDRQPIEGPQQLVSLTKPFYLGVHEVTVGQFRAFIKESNYQTEADKDGKGSIRFLANGQRIAADPQCTWQTPGWKPASDEPVVCVSWNDAMAFCQWLSQKEKRTYRLPTEAEWEYACRAGTTSAFTHGADLTPDQANYFETKGKANPERKIAKVGSYRLNTFGLYDMHGNVFEWSLDWIEQYPAMVLNNPRGAGQASLSALRGGGWATPSASARAAFRVGLARNFRSNDVGFRVVLEHSP